MNLHPRDFDGHGKRCKRRPASFPLLLAAAGEDICVRAITGAPGFVRRLMDLGLRAGLRARVVQHNAAGIVLAVDGMRLALGPAAAAQVMVALPKVRAGRGKAA